MLIFWESFSVIGSYVKVFTNFSLNNPSFQTYNATNLCTVCKPTVPVPSGDDCKWQTYLFQFIADSA